MMTLRQALNVADAYKSHAFLSTPAQATQVLAQFIKEMIGDQHYQFLLNNVDLDKPLVSCTAKGKFMWKLSYVNGHGEPIHVEFQYLEDVFELLSKEYQINGEVPFKLKWECTNVIL